MITRRTDTIDMSTESREYGRMTTQTGAPAASNMEQMAMTANPSNRRSGRSRSATAYSFCAAVMALASIGANAATYYVATTGNDSNPGTQASPWRTIQAAANKANAGDTVLVAGGTYAEKVTFTRSGAAGQPIVFQAMTGQTPVINGSNVGIGTYDGAVLFKGVGYIRFDGFEVANSPYYGIYVGGEAHHLQIANCNVHDSSSSGLWIEGPQNRPSFSSITGNLLHNNTQGGVTIWQMAGGYLLIDGNQVYSNIGTGNFDAIQVGGGGGGTHHVVVRNNLSHDNGQADTGEDNMDLGGHGINHHYLVEGNQAWGGTGSIKLHSGSAKNGYYTPGVSGFHIMRFNRFSKGYVSYGFPNPIAAYNNTWVDCDQCFMIYAEDSSQNQTEGDSTYKGGDAGRMVFKNNLYVQSQPSSSYLLLVTGPSGSTVDVNYDSVRFQNNVYEFAAGQKLGWANGAGTQGPGITAAAFASYQASNSPNNPDTGSRLTTAATSQLFANYAGRDFHPVAGSPAIDAGAPLTFATNGGTNSTTLKVDRASFFQDGYCVSGECVNTPDSIVVGSNPPVQIVSIDDANNVITLATPITWLAGAAVTLPYVGGTPDAGAYEYGAAAALAPPSNVRVINVQ